MFGAAERRSLQPDRLWLNQNRTLNPRCLTRAKRRTISLAQAPAGGATTRPMTAPRRLDAELKIR